MAESTTHIVSAASMPSTRSTRTCHSAVKVEGVGSVTWRTLSQSCAEVFSFSPAAEGFTWRAASLVVERAVTQWPRKAHGANERLTVVKPPTAMLSSALATGVQQPLDTSQR